MKTLNDQFGEIVEERLKALETNAFAVEQANGLPADAIRNVLRSQKKVGPTLSRAEEICRALDLEFYIGPRRPRGQGFAESGDNGAPGPLSPPDGYATFVWEGGELRGIPPMAFALSWIRRHGLDQDRHLCTYVGERPDDASAPSGLAVVDRLARREGGPAPWALRHTGGRVELARVQFEGALAMITGDSPDTPIRVLRPGTLSPLLLGRVLWQGSAT